ncbi:MAG TPA: hypothetical protein VK437_12810 [Steroidobacteraceae bacterium]|nr:hypothetical protein [Steroidobacteraceae bacterium]
MKRRQRIEQVYHHRRRARPPGHSRAIEAHLNTGLGVAMVDAGRFGSFSASSGI